MTWLILVEVKEGRSVLENRDPEEHLGLKEIGSGFFTKCLRGITESAKLQIDENTTKS